MAFHSGEGNNPVAQSADPFIQIEHVGLIYEGREGMTHALNDTTLAINKGEFVAVVGSSGCGKSSLLKLISGLHRPTNGSVAVGGREVTRPLKITGMAFQNPTLLPWRTTLDNILLPLEIVTPYAETFRARRGEYEVKAKELLGLVGLSGFEGKFPWELSGGMQQRSSLCRALIHEPEMLLLDEPFGALDVFTREELWSVLQTLCMEKKPTVVLVTHDLREAVYLADTIYVMSDRPGRILSRTEVRIPRPRTLEHTFDPEFMALTRDLRAQISHAKN
jgi:NitT/TauT family transport system ATP-binding protein